MVTRDFLQGRRGRQLTEKEKMALEGVVGPPFQIPRRTVVVRRGEPVTRSTFLVDGFMCRYIDDAEGARQFVSLETAGDFVDQHGYPLGYLDHGIATLSDCRVVTASHDDLTRLVETYPHLGRMLWFSTLTDAAMHREWIFRVGRLSADARVAHLFCETHARLAAVGRVADSTFDWPLTQQDLAEATGLTPVHVNRMLRTLRESGALVVRDRKAHILDLAMLGRIAQFDPAYLYLGDHSRTP